MNPDRPTLEQSDHGARGASDANAVVALPEEPGITVLDDPADVGSSLRSGLAWNTFLSVAIQATRFASSLILVRLLHPSDYGLAGMALIVAAFVSSFQDLGFGAVLVQRKSIDEEDRSTIFWTTAAMGLALTVLMAALAAPIAGFFHQPHVENLVRVLSLTLLIGSLGTTQGSLLARAMRYRTVALRLMIATISACVVGIAVAAAGGGPWTFIAYQLTITSLVTLLLWQASRWRPRLTYSIARLKSFGTFGVNVTGTAFVNFLQANVDNLLVGRYLGPRSLGIYSVSYNVILIPIGRLINPVAGTLFAATSRLQDDRERVARIWLSSVRAVIGLVAPTIVGLFIVAPDFVAVILGTKWMDAVPVIRILGFVTITYSLAFVSYLVLVGLGRPELEFRLSLANAVLAILAFVLGLRWGIVGVAACYVAVTVPVNLLAVGLTNRALTVSSRRCLQAVSGTCAATLLMAVVCWLVRIGLVTLGTSPQLRLAICVAISGAAYFVGTVLFNREFLADVKGIVRPHTGRTVVGTGP